MDGLVVVGGAGRLARAIKQACPSSRLATRQDLDVTDAASVQSALDHLQPSAVINTAAVPDVIRCEADPDLAFAVNAYGVAALAKGCAQRGVPLVHISTDYVFGARSSGPAFSESDPTNPLSTYGRSKLLGERLALEVATNVCVTRVAWLFGHEADFLTRMLRLAQGGCPLPVFRQTSSPTPILGLAHRLVTLAARMRTGVGLPSLLHLAGGPPASRREWLLAALTAYQAGGRAIGCEIVEVETPNIRPSFSALDSGLSATLFGAELDWRAEAASAGAAFEI